MRRLLAAYGKEFKLNFIAGPLLKLVEVIFDLMVPLVIAHLIDSLQTGVHGNVVVRYCLFLVLMACLGFSLALITQKLASTASQGIGSRLRSELFSYATQLTYAQLDEVGSAALITRIGSDTDQIQLAIALAIRQLVRWPLLALGSMLIALSLDFELGLIVLAATLAVIVVFVLVMRKSVVLFAELQHKLEEGIRILRESVLGARFVRAYVREDYERERLDAVSTQELHLARNSDVLGSILGPVSYALMYLAVCLILLLGAARVNNASMSMGTLVAFIAYVTQTLVSISYVANLVVIFTRAESSAQRIMQQGFAGYAQADTQHEASKPAILASPDIQKHKVQPYLVFDDVSFAYPQASAEALEHISFELLPGQNLGIIGGTGSGKSTLALLAAGLYKPSSGTINLEGKPLASYTDSQLREKISLVLQRPMLLKGSLAQNLRWRDVEASEQELWEVLDLAQAKDFVEKLDLGLATPVERGAINFSGGQRQRLSIARALLGKPELIILDDASSALDTLTEKALWNSLISLPKLSKIIISQRVSSIMAADLILVLDNGRLLNAGSHDYLKQTCPVYKELCDLSLSDGGVRV